MKILYGLLEPTEGVVTHRGDVVRLANPEAARALGIGMVFQHFSLCENLTVAENIALVMPRALRGRTLKARIAAVGGDLRAAPRPRPARSGRSRPASASASRSSAASCRTRTLVILDEPTSVLTPGEADLLFAVLERLRDEGRALLYISHRLDEVRRLCARATILRGGRVVGTCDPRAETARSLAAMMVGAQVGEVKPPAGQAAGPERLVLSGLTLPAPGLHGTALDGVSLSVRGGEIVGIAGIAGNGQAELFDALSGETLAPEPEMVRFDGVDVRPPRHHGPAAGRRRLRTGGAQRPRRGPDPEPVRQRDPVASRHGRPEPLRRPASRRREIPRPAP